MHVRLRMYPEPQSPQIALTVFGALRMRFVVFMTTNIASRLAWVKQESPWPGRFLRDRRFEQGVQLLA